MRRTSLVEAKAHLSELVDLAEHRGERILILRHGKPAAALVPVDVASSRTSNKPMTAAEVDELFESFGEVAGSDAVTALSADRSRLDRLGQVAPRTRRARSSKKR